MSDEQGGGYGGRPGFGDVDSGRAQPTEADRLRERLEVIAGMEELEQEMAMADLINEFRGRLRGSVLRSQLQEISNRRQRAENREGQNELINEINEKYFIMNAQSKVRVGSLEHRELNGHMVQSLNMMTAADFGLKMANRMIGRDPASEVWIRSPERREYSGFFIDPNRGQSHNGQLNLWTGLSVEPAKGPIYAFLRHIVMLAGGDRECAEYILNWLAWGVQHPSKPIGTVLIFIGEQGTGKGTLGNLMRSIYGNHGIRIGKAEDLIGKHNSHLISACFAFVDEPPFAGNKGVADVLKGMVTEPTLTVEPKFQDRYEVNNMLKIMCATNHGWAMQVEFSDRRYTAFSVPEEMRSMPKAYWDRFNNSYMSPEGKAAILHYLMGRDVTLFDPERHRPFTTVYLDQKVASLSADWLWWRLVGERETWQVGRSTINLPDYMEWQVNSVEMTKAGLYDMYAQWHLQTQRGSPTSASIFYRNANKWLLHPVRSYKRSGKRLEQVRHVFVPPFQDVAEKLMEYLAKGP